MEKGIEKVKVHNVIILDRSGSMQSIKKAAIDGYNELLNGVKQAKEKFGDTQIQLLSLVLFDSTSIDTLYWDTDPEAAKQLDEKTYVPGACTPLYDAMGLTINRLQKETADDPNATVLVTVITDGYENCSSKFSGAAIKSLVEELTNMGWIFAYMGTDHDVDQVTKNLSIRNSMCFDKTSAATKQAWDEELDARCAYYAGVAECLEKEADYSLYRKQRSLEADYYKKDKKDEK